MGTCYLWRTRRQLNAFKQWTSRWSAHVLPADKSVSGSPRFQAICGLGVPYHKRFGPGERHIAGGPISRFGGDGLLRVTCPPDTLLRGASYFETVPLVWGGSLRLAPNIHTSGRFDDVYTGGTNFEVCV